MDQPSHISWIPDLIYSGGKFQSEAALLVADSGNLVRIVPATEVSRPNLLKGRALLPGLVNAHSHAFQRVIRGRTEYRTANARDSFWTWREMMYSAATRLTPEDIYDASRMAYLEMVLSGITSVGEFHYLHHAPEGETYDDPNLLAKEVVRAARDVGLRIALLRVGYARAGFETETNPQQARFIEKDAATFLRNFESFSCDIVTDDGMVWTGIAPHSVRAVPLTYLKEIVAYAGAGGHPVHMHVAEQLAEVAACIAEYGRSPVALLETEGLLSERFSAVHAIHLTEEEISALARARALVCACPTTERNLGDGVVPADALFNAGVRISLGSDSQVQIDLMEDAREIEYHLRLQKMERAVLATDEDEGPSALAARLFECATRYGAESIGSPTGSLAAGLPADFFTVDLNDPAISGSDFDSLLAGIVFSSSPKAVREVVVAGKTIVTDGRHRDQEQIVSRFKALQNKLWG